MLVPFNATEDRQGGLTKKSLAKADVLLTWQYAEIKTTLYNATNANHLPTNKQQNQSTLKEAPAFYFPHYFVRLAEKRHKTP